ncbi:MAG: universal stress protein [bacterium]|nr:universal stress protein [bacterium]
MKRFKRILVATDTRYDTHPILAEAAEIAKNNNASITVVDVVPEYTWTVRLLVSDHEHMRALMAEEKREKLNALAKSLQDDGIDAKSTVLMGKTSVEIIREVLRGDYDLVMRVAKGKDSRRSGFFGNTGIQLLRKCPCAVWLVAPNTSPRFEHVMGCVDASTGDEIDLDLNNKIYELTSSISDGCDGKKSIVQAWSIFNEQMLVNRMTAEERRIFEVESQEHVNSLLGKFLKRQGDSIQNDHVHTIKGEPAAVITNFAKNNGVDLIVMGTVGRSGFVGMLMGNTAEQILSQIECSVLAVKPSRFQSPVQMEGEVESHYVFAEKPKGPQ